MQNILETLQNLPIPWTPLVRLTLAALLGGLIGIEREHHGRSAGFRTQLLVSLGAALAMVVSLHFATIYGDVPSDKSLRIDPARMAYGVMGGIGFLGAGAIIHFGIGVRGLTTAASLWCTAAIGLACGFGMHLEAIFTTTLVIFALVVLSKLEFLIPSRIYKTVTMKFPYSQQDNLARCRELFRQHKIRIIDLSYQQEPPKNTETLIFHICLKSHAHLHLIPDFVAKIPNVLRIKIN